MSASLNRRFTLQLVPPVLGFDLQPVSLTWPIAPSAALRDDAFELALTDGLEQRGRVIEGSRCVCQ